ncbi:DUF6503 family protein [Psychroflexus aestuariivivens]|uniref:DUF6503 family protein n=1 Tax=Psychroflexus aestuariivivens TaxID=1795040 RepID=UPI000FDB9CE4|nr:DUF6503 family protein [Psychroflexus aestuariivivens]
MKYFAAFSIFLLLSCSDSEEIENKLSEIIVEKAIEYSGKQKLNSHELEFDFRDYHYKSVPNCNGFTLSRIQHESKVKDVLKNGKLTRYRNDSIVELADSTAFKYKESLNSVHYFMQLPLRLQDQAVNKKYIGKDTIENKIYYKIQITFDEKDGGEDFQDVFQYWFENETFSMDYLAYSFMTNGGGLRFRKAINPREIDGVKFQDYENYKPKSDTAKLSELSKHYKNDELELLSKIENENIQLKPKKLDCE